ncbi:MAG: amidohydrolase family protein, partial [Acidobacteria bacterium]|nr:amidohydrolase family protein [Acidobacteriota bacterium]
AGIGPYHVFTQYKIDAAFTQYGTERINQMASFKSHLEAGLKTSLEGDTFGDPPFWKFYVALTRKDQKYGKVWNPTEKVTRQEALWMGTINGAYQLGEEDKLGSIEPGKLADVIVLDRDFMTIPEDDIPNIQVLLTIVGGKAVYEVKGAL